MINKNDFDGNLVYGGSRFHKSTKRDNVIADSSIYYRDYVVRDGDDLIPDKYYFESVESCLVCDSLHIEVKLKKKGLLISQCQSCGFGFQNPRFKKEHLPRLYGREYPLSGAYASESQNELDQIKYEYAIQELSKYTSIKSVLDIGAGNMHFLKTCKQYGVTELYGIEPGSNLSNASSSVNLITEFSDKVPKELEGLSVITMWDTLEHIHGFKTTIDSAYRALSRGGVLLIMVPNFYSLASRLIRESSPTFSIYHLNYFEANSLECLLKGVGFDIVQKETVISEIDNCRNYLEFQEPYMSVPHNEKAFDWLTPDYIHKNMMGSRLFFIAQKSG